MDASSFGFGEGNPDQIARGRRRTVRGAEQRSMSPLAPRQGHAVTCTHCWYPRMRRRRPRAARDSAQRNRESGPAPALGPNLDSVPHALARTQVTYLAFFNFCFAVGSIYPTSDWVKGGLEFTLSSAQQQQLSAHELDSVLAEVSASGCGVQSVGLGAPRLGADASQLFQFTVRAQHSSRPSGRTRLICPPRR